MPELKKPFQTGMWLQMLAAALVIGVIHFNSLHRLLTFEWDKSNFLYCWTIPFIVGILIWMRRQELSALAPRPSWLGIVAVLIGVFFLFLGEFGGEYLSLYLSIWFMVVGMGWVIFGWRKLKVVWFPLALLLTTFPPPRIFYVHINSAVQNISTAIAVQVLRLLEVPVFRQGNALEFQQARFEVIGAYSGLRYVIPIGIAALLIAYLAPVRLWKRLFVLTIALPLGVGINGLRIALVSFMASARSNAGIERWVVDALGWATVAIAVGIFLAVVFFLPGQWWATRDPADTVDNGRLAAKFSGIDSMAIGRRLPIAFFVAVTLLVGVFAFVQYRAHTTDYLPQARSFSGFPDRIGPWQGRRSFLSAEMIDDLDLTDYVQMEYNGPGNKPVDFYVSWYTTQSKGKSIHTPETCLRIGDWRFLDSRVIHIVLPGYGRSPLRLKRVLLTNRQARWLMYFWFQVRGRELVNAYELKLFNFWDRLVQRRTDGSLIRVMTPIEATESTADAEKRMQRFLGAALPVLNTYIPN